MSKKQLNVSRFSSYLLLVALVFINSAALAQQLPPSCAQGYQEVVLDFDNDAGGSALATGEVITNQYAAHQVSISVINSTYNLAVIYDSSCSGPFGCTPPPPASPDFDLGSPNQDFGGPGIGAGGEATGAGPNMNSLNNILIISDKPDLNSDGIVENPGDDPSGGTIVFDFAVDVRLLRIDFLDLDIEQNESLEISGSKNAVPSFTTVSAPPLGDNAFETVYIYENNTSDRVEIAYGNTSGAVAEVRFCVPEPDCLGVPGGSAVVDQCGICDGNGTSCLDCLGVPFGNAVYDECEVCDGDGSTCSDCLGVPYGNAVVDQCGVCDGDGTSCLDCLNNPNGNAQFDDCGICNGGNKDKDDCGICFGNNAAKDDCGVCNGNNTAKDDCGVCFGSNEAKDECGVCNGNGFSCLECTDVDIRETQFALDGLGEDQFRLLAKAVKLYRKKSGVKSALAGDLEEGKLLKLSSWEIAWSMPNVLQTNCSNAALCVAVDNAPTLNSYSDNSNGLDKLIKKTIRKVNRQFGRPKQAKKLSKQRKSLAAERDTLVGQIPVEASSCE